MALVAFCEIVCSIGGVTGWALRNLCAPILTGAVAGFVVPLAFRWESTPGEIRQHNREAKDLNEDFRRFMSDLGRQVQGAFRRLESERHVAEIKANLQEEEPSVRDRLQQVADRYRREREAKEVMGDALWRYRDEALRKRGRFLALVESESKRHERRRRARGSYPVLAISQEARQALASWRSRSNLFSETDEGDDLLLADFDPTASEFVLLPLETDEGLTWDAAKQAVRT
jgi:hypothetical protein